MTDFDSNSDEFGASYLDPADEAVSAYVDGEATAEEQALVEASPELMARVAEIESFASRMTSELSTPSETRRDEMVTNALAAWADQRLENAGMDPADARFDDLDDKHPDAGAESSNQPPSARLAALGTAETHAPSPAATGTTSGANAVGDLAAARRRRDRARAALGAVAAVVLLVLAVPLIGQLSSRGDSDEVASTAAESADDGSGDSDDATSGTDDAGDAGGGGTDSLDAASSVDGAAMEDSDTDDAMADDAIESDGEATEAAAAPATTTARAASTTTANAAAQEAPAAEDDDEQAAAGSAAAVPSTAAAGVEDLGLVPDVDALRAILESTDVTAADGTEDAGPSPVDQRESIDGFLAACALELGEPDVVAVAELPDGTVLYVTGSFDVANGADDPQLIVDGTCTVVGTSP